LAENTCSIARGVSNTRGVSNGEIEGEAVGDEPTLLFLPSNTCFK